jgi:phospholipid/cholesterol/gamma-HCH transport system ATP-binding protein
VAQSEVSVLQVQKISFSFEPSRSPLIKELSFEGNEGEVICLLGPSGAGKTTVLKILAGIIEPKAGTTQILQGPLGMSFQQGGLLDCFNVFENVEFPLKELTTLDQESRRGEVEKILASVGLMEHQKKRIHELSGGMQKRVSLARAFILKPKLLLLDEPAGGLDPISTQELAELIRIFQKNSQACTVFATSDLNLCQALSSHVLFLCPGISTEKVVLQTFFESKDLAVQQYVNGRLNGPIQGWNDA